MAKDALRADTILLVEEVVGNSDGGVAALLVAVVDWERRTRVADGHSFQSLSKYHLFTYWTVFSLTPVYAQSSRHWASRTAERQASAVH